MYSARHNDTRRVYFFILFVLTHNCSILEKHKTKNKNTDM